MNALNRLNKARAQFPGLSLREIIAKGYGLQKPFKYGKSWASRYRSFIIVDHSLVSGFRDCGDYPSLSSSRDAGGWYADDYQDETYTGHAWQLPGRDHTPRYIGGFIPSNDCAITIDATNGQPTIFDSSLEAASAGDDLASIHAEYARESCEAYSAESSARDDMQAHYDDAHATVTLLRDQRAYGPLATGICERLQKDIKRSWAKARAQLKELREASENLRYAEESYSRYAGEIIR